MRAKIRGVCEPLGFSLASLFFNSSRKEGRRIFLKASSVSTGNWCSRYVSVSVHSSEFFTVFGLVFMKL